jgi:Na+-transporting methylmalonyl-CoA/oxaloacetate decarboxylase gamma subunit
MNTQKWFGVGIVVIILIAVVYFIGQYMNPQSQSVPAPTSQSPQPTPSVNQNLFNESQNESNCKEIAVEAVNSDNQEYAKKNFLLSQSAYNNSLNGCYYETDEIQDDNSYYALNLMSAPDDAFIASCAHYSDGADLCYGTSSVEISETQFDNLVSYYLGN